MNNTSHSATEWASKPTFLHLRNNAASPYQVNVERHFSRLPLIGEEIALTKNDFYVVESVVYIGFDDTAYSAEVYARKIDEPGYHRLTREAIER